MFAIGLLALVGGLQVVFIRPYYRNNKISMIKEVATTIQGYMIDNPRPDDLTIKKASQYAVSNNVCAIIYNEKGMVIYSSDSLGSSCLFNQRVTLNGKTFKPSESGNEMLGLLANEKGELSEVVANNRIEQEMILYGRKVQSNLGNFYLFVNSPLELNDSTLAIYQDQFLFLAAGVLLMSVIISLFISTKLSKPIVKMKFSAKELSQGHYTTTFEGSYFSEINELADTLNDATHKLSKVDELRKDLIANVSHDIKTPLTMIKAYAEMIRDISGDNPKKREEHLEVIVKEVDYLDHLVTDMQELSKMQTGNVELNWTSFNLYEKILNLLSLCQVMVEDHEIRIQVLCSRDLMIYADDIKIGQVIYNFLSNALKHTENGKSITIRVFEKSDGVHVEVEDEGVGIKKEDLPYIWDRYYKIDKQFRRAVGGTGLGLAIVKAILESHKAEFGVESQEGKGSKFWFVLPNMEEWKIKL